MIIPVFVLRAKSRLGSTLSNAVANPGVVLTLDRVKLAVLDPLTNAIVQLSGVPVAPGTLVRVIESSIIFPLRDANAWHFGRN